MEWTTAKPISQGEEDFKHANVPTMRSRVAGAIVHSHLSSQVKLTFAYLGLFELPQDPNLIVNALICVLDKWNRHHGLAPVLYITLDNSA